MIVLVNIEWTRGEFTVNGSQASLNALISNKRG